MKKFLFIFGLVPILSCQNNNKVENGHEIKKKTKASDKFEAKTKKNNPNQAKTQNPKKVVEKKQPPKKIKPPKKLMVEYFNSMSAIIAANLKNPDQAFVKLNQLHKDNQKKYKTIRDYYKKADAKDFESLFTDHKNNSLLIKASLKFNKNLIKLAKKAKGGKVKGYQEFIGNLIKRPLKK